MIVFGVYCRPIKIITCSAYKVTADKAMFPRTASLRAASWSAIQRLKGESLSLSFRSCREMVS